MKARVLFGVFGFAFVLLALYVFPPIVLELVVAALCVFATYEVLGSTKLVRNHLELLLAMAVSLGLAVGHFSILPLQLESVMQGLVLVLLAMISLVCGGAVLGAPLTHDFAVVSLSDRLTPWETIEKRLLCAAEADLAIAIYNPASHGRPDHLKRACEILLRVLPEDRLCGVVRNIGREGQSRRVLTLGALKTAQIDMFCTVFIGNAATKLVADELVTPRGYRDV